MSTDLQRWLDTRAEPFLQAVGIPYGATVLDFGCRRGVYTIPAARLVGPPGTVYAADKDENILDELMQQAAVERLTNVRRIDTHGGVSVPLEDETVDVILLYDVVHLIGWAEDEHRTLRKSTTADRRRLLEEMRRVAKQGALLSVYAPHLGTHTDATSEDEIRAEIESCGFRFAGDLHRDLVHDEKLVQGHVLNFTRNA